MADVEELVEKTVDRKLMEMGGGLAAVSLGAGALGFIGGRVAADPNEANAIAYFEQMGDAEYPVSELYLEDDSPPDTVIDSVKATEIFNVPNYESPAEAPNGTHFWNETEELMMYKNAAGEVHGHGFWVEVSDHLEPDVPVHEEVIIEMTHLRLNFNMLRIQDTEPSNPEEEDVWFK